MLGEHEALMDEIVAATKPETLVDVEPMQLPPSAEEEEEPSSSSSPGTDDAQEGHADVEGGDSQLVGVGGRGRRCCPPCVRCRRLYKSVYCGFELRMLLAIGMAVILPTVDSWTDWAVSVSWYLDGDYFWAGLGASCQGIAGMLAGHWLARGLKMVVSWPPWYSECVGLLLGFLGLTPMMMALLALQARSVNTVAVLPAVKALEVLTEAIPQAALQTYVGVSYGTFDPSTEDFNPLLPVSVTISLLGSGATYAEFEMMERGDIKPGLSFRMTMVLLRAAQVTSLVFGIALLGCAFKAMAVFAVLVSVLLVIGIALEGLTRRKRSTDFPWSIGGLGGLLKEESMVGSAAWGVVHLLVVGGMGLVFMFVEHLPNNYADISKPAGPPGSPQHIDCHLRTSGIYPALLAVVVGAVLLLISLFTDPEFGATRYRKQTWRQRLAVAEHFLLDSKQDVAAHKAALVYEKLDWNRSGDIDCEEVERLAKRGDVNATDLMKTILGDPQAAEVAQSNRTSGRLVSHGSLVEKSIRGLAGHSTMTDALEEDPVRVSAELAATTPLVSKDTLFAWLHRPVDVLQPRSRAGSEFPRKLGPFHMVPTGEVSTQPGEEHTTHFKVNLDRLHQAVVSADEINQLADKGTRDVLSRMVERMTDMQDELTLLRSQTQASTKQAAQALGYSMSFKGPLEKLNALKLRGMCSAAGHITLPDVDKTLANIPVAATQFVWCHPVRSKEGVLGAGDNDQAIVEAHQLMDNLQSVCALADLSFFLLGGFTYFDEHGKFLQVSCATSHPRFRLNGIFCADTVCLCAWTRRPTRLTAATRRRAMASPFRTLSGGGQRTPDPSARRSDCGRSQWTRSVEWALDTFVGMRCCVLRIGAFDIQLFLYCFITQLLHYTAVDCCRLMPGEELHSDDPIGTHAWSRDHTSVKADSWIPCNMGGFVYVTTLRHDPMLVQYGPRVLC